MALRSSVALPVAPFGSTSSTAVSEALESPFRKEISLGYKLRAKRKGKMGLCKPTLNPGPSCCPARQCTGVN